MNFSKIFLIIATVFSVAACSSLNLTPADFAWPLETVLKIDKDGFVKEDRYSLKFNTQNLFLAETEDSLGYAGKSIRLIRNDEGFYFMTAADFKNIYIFSVEKDAFVLKNTIQINETGLKNPALNQRSPYIELVDEGMIYKLTSEGIEEGVK